MSDYEVTLVNDNSKRISSIHGVLSYPLCTLQLTSSSVRGFPTPTLPTSDSCIVVKAGILRQI
jgi:hypothetical protein